MNREQIKRFIEMVDTGAQLKAYKRELGLDYNAYKYHLTRLHYYRSLFIEEDDAEPVTLALKGTSVVEKDEVVEDESESESDEAVEDSEDEDEPAPNPRLKRMGPVKELKSRKTKDEEEEK